MTVIDSATYKVIATVPLGKRPRGIHASPDRKTIYVALSGSPIAGPGVDESTLPPPDKSADGIGVFDVAQNKVVRVIKGGSDPENFDVSKDGTQMYISNEDDAAVSVVDIASGTVVKSAKVGGAARGREGDSGRQAGLRDFRGDRHDFGVRSGGGQDSQDVQGWTSTALGRISARWLKGLRQRRERWHGRRRGRREAQDDCRRFRSASRA